MAKIEKKDSKWDEETISKLKKMYLEDNMTTAKIGEALGFTKNAVIGKINRLGLKKVVNKTETKAKQTKSRKNISQLVLGDKKQQDNHELKKENIANGNYRLEDLSFNMCLWTDSNVENDKEDEFLFCGKKVMFGKSYCEEHLNLVYISSKKNSKKRKELYYTKEDIEDSIEE